MDENKIREIEARELTAEESEKVAGGSPHFSRHHHRMAAIKKAKEKGKSDGKKVDDGSVSGSGSW